jgi:hypothetical protein
MKPNRYHLRNSILGVAIAMALSLAYLFWGSWDFLGWSPEPIWAQILFFPGIVVGHLCWDHILPSELFCRILGVFTMGMVGGTIGFAASLIIHHNEDD